MKLYEIKPSKPEDFATVEDGTVYSYVVDRGCRDGALIFPEYPDLYTEEDMIKFMKSNVDRALLLYGATFESNDGYLKTYRRLTTEERQEIVNNLF